MSVASFSMRLAPYVARSSPDCSNSTMCRPIIQYAPVMKAFTDRAADCLAASTIPVTSRNTVSYCSSRECGVTID